MNRYPSYRETVYDWIGEIPSDWNLTRGRFLFKSKKELNRELQCENLLSLTLFGVLNKDYESSDGLRPESYNSYQIFQKDDLVFKMIDLENVKTSRVGIVHEEGIMSPVYLRHEPIKSKIDPRFAYWFYYDLYKKEIYNSIGSGVRSSLSSSDLLEMELPVPPIEQQKLISRYLDKKIEQIDRLVEKIQKKIELLEEQRTLLINQCVTKGLDTNVEMKDSGVEWIGDIPSHWDIISLRFCAEMLRGKFSHRPRNDPDFYDGDYPFIQTGDISKSKKYLTSYSQTLNERGYSVSKEFPIDTLVMGIAANIGNVSILKIKSCFPDSIVGFYPKSNWKIDFLYFLFSSMTDEFIRNSIVSTQLNLNIDRIGDIKIPMVPPKEQEDICSFLDKSEDRYDHFLKLYNKKIQKLHEYRQSLISSAVTGKMRITEDMI